MSFNNLGLSPTLLQAVLDTGYTTPTPIQAQAIPAILTGKDVMAAAQTGTGKTAGFTLPLLQLLGGKEPVRANHTRALILTPTRELAAQIQDSIETYGKHEKLKSVVVFGGVNINPQQMALRRGCDILVATPGRLLDLYQQNAVKFQDIEVLILDEADRMLDMGFIRDIRKILGLLPKKRQNLMFSATFSDEIRTLAKTICHQPVEIDVAPRNSTVELITQTYYSVSKDKKIALLGKLLQDTREQVLVFSRTKHGANALVKKLAGYDVDAAAIHGNKSQAQRTKALAEFKANKTQVLVATDIAARGIDIDLLAMVINFDMPQVPEDYVHRIGRTGRAGATGLAVSLVTDEDTSQLRAIERLIKRKIPRADFNPNELPVAKAVAAESVPARQSSQPRPQRPASRQPRQSQPQRPQQSNKPRIINGNSEEGSLSPRRVDDKARQGRPSGHARPAGNHGTHSAEPGQRQHGQQSRRQGPQGNTRSPQGSGNQQSQPRRSGSARNDGARSTEHAAPQGESMWSSLGRNLRSGRLFSRK